MKCLVVTPEKTVLDMETTSVMLPLIDGEYGVLPGHSPVVGRIGAGELQIKSPKGENVRYYIEGGFVEILDDVVAILSMHAMPVEELDVARAEQQYEDALKRPGNTPDLAQLREEKLYSRRARLRIAKKFAK